MNIQPILNFLDVVDASNCSANMLLCIRKEQGLQEYSDMVRSKRKDFESCILEWCMQHGANAALSLTIHKEKLVRYSKDYERQKELFISLINSMGESLEPFLTSPFSVEGAPVRIEKPNDKENKRIKNYFRFILLEVGDSIRFIDKMIDAYGKIDIPDIDNKTDNIITNTNVYYTTNYTNKQLRRVYKYLIGNGHLEADNLLSDFIYFFTGRGEKVNNCLKWSSERGAKVNLAFFLIAITGGERKSKIWEKAKVIFNKTGLAQSFNEAPEASIYERKISQDVLDLLK